MFDRPFAPGVPAEDRAWPLFLTAALAITALRIAGLAMSGAELYYDEAQYWSWGQEPAFGYFSKPPMLALIIGTTTSVCGDGEFCVRLPAPLMHLATSMVIFALARRMFDGRTGLWAGLAYLTMPGTSLSASLISTDVPLLFFWTAALYALWRFMDTPGLGWGLAFGLALGLGVNTKYAMLFFPACVAIFLAFTSEKRRLAWHPGLLAGFALAALMIAPNLYWIHSHGDVTVSHVVSDGGSYSKFPNFEELGEFFLAQAGIMGPVPFVWAGLFMLGLRRHLADQRYRYLFAMSAPIFALFYVQAFISKANGNWAATGFPALIVLTIAFMLSRHAWRSLAATAAFALAAVLIFASYGLLIGRVTLQPIAGELDKLRGWSALADTVEASAREAGVDTVVTWERAISASMTYYMRDSGLTLKSYANDGSPRDHFEMTRPWYAGDAGPVLFVGKWLPQDIDPGRVSFKRCFSTQIAYFHREGALCVYRLENEAKTP